MPTVAVTIVAPNLAEVTGNVVLSGSSLSLPGATTLAAQTMNVNGLLTLPARRRWPTRLSMCLRRYPSLPELMTISGTNVTLNGSGVVEAPKLASMTGAANGTRYISVSTDSEFNAPLLTSLENVRLFASHPARPHGLHL